MRLITMIRFLLFTTTYFCAIQFGTTQATLPPDMVTVKGGTFIMGCTPEQEPDCNFVNDNAHEVTVPTFQIGKYEVTQGQWQALFGSNPANFTSCGSNCPVEQVSWYDALVFCNRLSEQSGFEPRYYTTATFATNSVYGKSGTTWSLPNTGTIYEKPSANGYRLPTEAEWEYAARGGSIATSQTKYAGSNDLNAVGWYPLNSGGTTHPIGQKAANTLGLFDMSGNVFEICTDGFGNYNTSPSCAPVGPPANSSWCSLRGGGWYYVADGCRVSARNVFAATDRNNFGLRLARTP